jgi:hypothetical protein
MLSLSLRNNYFNDDLRADFDLYLTRKNEAVCGRKKRHGKATMYGFRFNVFIDFSHGSSIDPLLCYNMIIIQKKYI